MLEDEGGYAVCSRFWGKTDADLQRLLQFLQRVSSFSRCRKVVLAINEELDHTDAIRTLAQMSLDKVEVLAIRPWPSLTKLLNRLLDSVTEASHPVVLFHSPEVQASEEQLDILRDRLDDQTLVVGGRLDGHAFMPGQEEVTIRGDTVPWNTLAFWSVSKLIKTMFPSEANLVNPPGLEELVVLAHQQVPFPRVELVHIQSAPLQWHTSFSSDRERQAYHEIKMQSKRDRGKQLLDLIKPSSTCVIAHIQLP